MSVYLSDLYNWAYKSALTNPIYEIHSFHVYTHGQWALPQEITDGKTVIDAQWHVLIPASLFHIY